MPWGLRELSRQSETVLLFYPSELRGYGRAGERFRIPLEATSCCDESRDPRELLVSGTDGAAILLDPATGAELDRLTREQAGSILRTERYEVDWYATPPSGELRPNVRRRDGTASWTASRSPWWIEETSTSLIVPDEGGVAIYAHDGTLERRLAISGVGDGLSLAGDWIVEAQGIAGEVGVTNIRTGERRIVTEAESTTLDACAVAPTWRAQASSHGIVVTDRGVLSVYPLPN